MQQLPNGNLPSLNKAKKQALHNREYIYDIAWVRIELHIAVPENTSMILHEFSLNFIVLFQRIHLRYYMSSHWTPYCFPENTYTIVHELSFNMCLWNKFNCCLWELKKVKSKNVKGLWIVLYRCANYVISVYSWYPVTQHFDYIAVWQERFSANPDYR